MSGHLGEIEGRYEERREALDDFWSRDFRVDRAICGVYALRHRRVNLSRPRLDFVDSSHPIFSITPRATCSDTPPSIVTRVDKMSAEDEQSQSGYEDGLAGGPGAPTPLSALEGTAGLTKRDIQLFVDGGYNTVESVAYT